MRFDYHKHGYQTGAIAERILNGEKPESIPVQFQKDLQLMKHVISFGNRLIMLHQGKILLDLHGKEKENLTVKDLLEQFYTAQGEELALDSLLLN